MGEAERGGGEPCPDCFGDSDTMDDLLYCATCRGLGWVCTGCGYAQSDCVCTQEALDE